MSSGARLRRVFLSLFLFFQLGWAHEARAQVVRGSASATSRDLVAVGAEACNEAFVAELRHALQIELGARLCPGACPLARRALLLCAGETFSVSVETRGLDGVPGERPAVRESIDLSATPSALRARVLALRMAELVRAREHDEAEPNRAAQESFPVHEKSEARGRRAERFSLAAFVEFSSFHRDPRPFWGAGMRLAYRLAPLSLGLDLAFAAQKRASTLGDLRVLLAHLAPHIAWSFAWSEFALKLGVGYALGIASMRGSPLRDGVGGATLHGVWAAPFASLELEYALGARFRVRAQGSLGWVQPGVVGEVARARDAQVEGLWTQAQAGLAVLL